MDVDEAGALLRAVVDVCVRGAASVDVDFRTARCVVPLHAASTTMQQLNPRTRNLIA
jgi:hypothetical protein